MISGALIGDRALIARFRAIPAAAKGETDRLTDRLTFELSGIVQRDYLSGQVLKVRTNRLRASITRGAQDSRTRVELTATTSFGYVGTNVVYGATWEYGARLPAIDILPRKARALRFEIGGQIIFSKRAHIPAREIAARPYLAPALQHYKPTIIASYDALLTRVATQTLKG